MTLDIENLRKQYSDLEDRELRWDEACEVCELPKLVHKTDTRCRKTPDLNMDEAWKGFRMLMELVRDWHREDKEIQIESNFTQEPKEHRQKDNNWECDLCGKQYQSREELEEHQYDYHEKKCGRCEK